MAARAGYPLRSLQAGGCPWAAQSDASLNPRERGPSGEFIDEYILRNGVIEFVKATSDDFDNLTFERIGSDGQVEFDCFVVDKISPYFQSILHELSSNLTKHLKNYNGDLYYSGTTDNGKIAKELFLFLADNSNSAHTEWGFNYSIRNGRDIYALGQLSYNERSVASPSHKMLGANLDEVQLHAHSHYDTDREHQNESMGIDNNGNVSTPYSDFQMAKNWAEENGGEMPFINLIYFPELQEFLELNERGPEEYREIDFIQF